jgi:predicted dehydrogenase
MARDRIRLGMIGAGLFARDVHLPALLAEDSPFEIAAVYSRTLSSASALAQRVPYAVDACDDLSAMLARPDIEAVDIVLPIPVQPLAVEGALAAGKHVISEKPIAPTMPIGRRLLATYRRHPRQVWVVAENVRYDAAYVRAAETIANGAIGRPLMLTWTVPVQMTEQNRYYHTQWRRDGSVPGGMLLDGGIHQMATLRMMLGDVAEVSAVTAAFRPDLPPVDSLSAVLHFNSGALGVFGLTFAAGAQGGRPLSIIGEGGALTVTPTVLQVSMVDTIGTIPFTHDPLVRDDVRRELAAFAAVVRDGAPHRNSPQECLRDLALFEAMLRSAATGRRTRPVGI